MANQVCLVCNERQLGMPSLSLAAVILTAEFGNSIATLISVFINRQQAFEEALF
jgi:hypothetical protein